MSSSVFQAQWSLSDTSDSVLKIARSALIAATSDNVQALALLCCERFGGTIAMSQQTCQVIEESVLPVPEPAPVRFLQALVGWSQADATQYFGQSQHGIKFLGLAAALVSTADNFISAGALRQMLQESTQEARLPTTRQLYDLLQSIEGRCNRCGFMDSVLSWQRALQERTLHIQGQVQTPTISNWYPSPDGLSKLVDSLRQLHRIGDATLVQVSVTARCCAPWVIAFVEWCTGEAPSIIASNGSQLHSNPKSKVGISLGVMSDTGPTLDGFRITTHHTIGSARELAVAGILQGPYCGLARIETYGSWLFRTHELDRGSAHEAAKQALPMALHQVLECIRFSEYRKFDHTVLLPEWHSPEGQLRSSRIDQTLERLRLYPFQGESAVSNALKLLTGWEKTALCASREPLIECLPKVEFHRRSLQNTCYCNDCVAQHSTRKFITTGLERCKTRNFFQQLSIVIADVLALSLFDDLEGLRLQIRPTSHDVFSTTDLRAVVEAIITTGQPVKCSYVELLDWALFLVGHDVVRDSSAPNEQTSWVMSCYSGQAVWPRIFDTQRIDKFGFLSLSWLQGKLQYNGDTYEYVEGDIGGVTFLQPGFDSFEQVVSKPCNLVPQLRRRWRITIANDTLMVSLGLEGMGSLYQFVTVCPSNILANLATALVLDNCPHEDKGGELRRADRFCRFTGPYNVTQPAFNSSEDACLTVGVAAVDGSDSLRMFAMGAQNYQVPIIIRKWACMQCCLDVCRQTNFPVIVL